MVKSVSFKDNDFQENYGYLLTTTPTPEDSSEEDAAIGIFYAICSGLIMDI